MYEQCLDKAGRRLLQQRQELALAEKAFRAQYEEVKRSVESQLEQARASVEESERKALEGLAEVERSGQLSELSNREKLRRELDETMSTLRAELAKNEALFRAHLEEAARIIADKE